MNNLHTIYWASSSHWDREWYRPLEGFRCRLLDMIDRAVDHVENVPGYGYFFLDGQSIILQDYLEIHPEQRTHLKKLLKQEKFFAGPFYVLQDEMIEDGEFLIRNLQKGISIAKSYGSKHFVGYTPDSFGHCAQLPQILKLAGIDSVIFSRGFLGTQQTNIWKAPNGSTVFFVWLPFAYGGGVHEDCLDDGRHIPEDQGIALQRFEKHLENLKPYVKNGILLIIDGGDHLSADIGAVRLAKDFNAKYKNKVHFRITSLINAIKDLSQHGKFNCVSGEMRKPGLHGNGWILPGTYSARMPLKYGLTITTRSLLALEKLYILRPYSQTVEKLLQRSWDFLLQNIPHDCICGCHIDEVYLANLSRLNSATSTIAYLYEKALTSFQKKSSTTGKKPKAIFYDPHPDTARFKPFVLECPYQVITDPEVTTLESASAEFIISDVERYHTNFSHLTTYRFKGLYRNRSCHHIFSVNFVTGKKRTHYPEQQIGVFSHGNYTVEFCKDGSFTICNHEKKSTYGPLMLFVDSGDAGDTYNYSPPHQDSTFTSQGTTQNVRVHELRPGLLRIKVDMILSVPRSLTDDRNARSQEHVELPIQYEVHADLDNGTFWIFGSFKNTACDHRLRAAFKTPFQKSHSYSGAPFHIEKRSVAPEHDITKFSERPLTDYPFVDFVSYGDLLVLSHSNGEYQITDQGIEITICRSIGYLGRPDLLYRKGQCGPFFEVPMAQLLTTKIDFGFVLLLTNENADTSFVHRELLLTSSSHCILSDDPSSIGLNIPIEVEGATLSALRKKSEQEIEIRLFNPSPQKVIVHLKTESSFKECTQVDLNGQQVKGGLRFRTVNKLFFKMNPYQILTLRAVLASSKINKAK